MLREPLLAKNDDVISVSLCAKLTRIKFTKTKTSYNKTLTRFHLTMYGIGNTIGAGIFALTGLAV